MRIKTKSDKSDTIQRKRATFLRAFERTVGNVSLTCKRANISRDTYYRWRKEDKGFAVKTDEIKEMFIDFTESKLFELIGKGNITAIIFFLRTRGKHRGYTEKEEDKHGGEIIIQPPDFLLFSRISKPRWLV